jgi:hydroxymethylbilane synthase
MAATFLAYAGLKRLGKADAAREVMPIEIILPAVGQGALAATFRADDKRVRALLQPLVDPATEAAVWAERAMLAILDGSCQTPIAAYGRLDNGILTLKGMIAHPGGIQIVEAEASGPAGEADQVGVRVANELLFKAGPALLRAIKSEQPHIYRVPTDPPI